MEWNENVAIRVAIRADTYGCLAVHRHLDREGWTVSHTTSGFSLEKLWKGHLFPEKSEARHSVVALVNGVDDLDRRLGELSRHQLTEEQQVELARECRRAIVIDKPKP